MQVFIVTNAVTQVPDRRLALRRRALAVLSRFGAELGSVRIDVTRADDGFRCRVQARGPRFSAIEVVAGGIGDIEALVNTLELVQIDVAAALGRARNPSLPGDASNLQAASIRTRRRGVEPSRGEA